VSAHNRVARNVGRYNLCAPGEQQAQYVFTLRADAPAEVQKTRAFLVSLDEDSCRDEEPYNVALFLASKAWGARDREAARKLADYLDPLFYDDLIAEYEARAESLRKRLAQVERDIAQAKADREIDAAEKATQAVAS